MAKVHTDVEALYGIRDAIIKLGDQMLTARQNFQSSFEQLSGQIFDHIRQIDREIESIGQDSDPDADGRTDSSCFTECGGRKKDALVEQRNNLKNAGDSLDNYSAYIQSLLNTDGAADGSGFHTEHFIATLNLWLASMGDYNATHLASQMSSGEEVKGDHIGSDSPFAPNRKSPRDLLVTQYSFEKREDGASVYDSPEETGVYLCAKQGHERKWFKGTCGLCSCANVIRLAGVDVREGDVIDYASGTNASNSKKKLCETGHLNPCSNGGTSPWDRKEILAHFGIDSGIFNLKRDSSGSVSEENIQDIAKYVSDGRGVIISVHAYALWHGMKNSKRDFHAITVTSVKKDAAGNVVGFYVCDTGIGGTQYYPADVLLGSLTGLPMNVTSQIIR